ncbi:SGNH/GDSL hydrolase family protein [Mycolicibacterium frederiksbergense]|uniref:SGNH/GDSL hydrolase family protein n=1 Tax=Mycolicibacterium frederiksbergense TaxID=117567 RepID=UPI00265C0D32|nr:hypothetical protein [Mycolicibacterium frederiksbergense]MDO0978181.1 hypothetical protein [Mycolicibacterium frederiksbergense]
MISSALRGDMPLVISIVGDSTGNNVEEWVHLVAQRIAATYNRPVTVHDWKTEERRYKSQETYPGAGAPVTIWNGSASGKPPQYSTQWYPKLAPVPVNLTIISHSHTNPQRVVEGIEHLIQAVDTNTLPGGGVVVILQNPRTDNVAELQQSVVDELRQIYSDPAQGVAVVDVNAAFRAGYLPDLLDTDGANVNPRGSQLWADTVWQALHG